MPEDYGGSVGLMMTTSIPPLIMFRFLCLLGSLMAAVTADCETTNCNLTPVWAREQNWLARFNDLRPSGFYVTQNTVYASMSELEGRRHNLVSVATEHIDFDHEGPADLVKANGENHPRENAPVWFDVTTWFPQKAIEAMTHEFHDFTNCFAFAFCMRGLIRIGEGNILLEDLIGTDYEELHNVQSEDELKSVSVALMYLGERWVHAFIPLGNSGWVLTKNGYRLGAARLMRLSGVLHEYGSGEDRSFTHSLKNLRFLRSIGKGRHYD